MEILRAEPSSVRGEERLAIIRSGEPVDGVGSPQPIEVCKALFPEGVVVVLHLRDVGEIVGSHVEVPRDPNEREREVELDL
jgi:hypothetical protein